MTALSRRSFLGAVSTIALQVSARSQDAGRTSLVLLGTAGGPTPKIARSAPAQAVVAGDRVYLFDCGDGVARQMTLAKLPFSQLRAIFITHQHSDHNAGYGPLLLLGWTAGLAERVDTYGPPPMTTMTRLLLEAYRFDIDLRIRDEGRAPLAPLVRPHDITASGEVFKDDRVRVRAALNNHPPIEHSFAYRIDAPDRSIVISGDTTYSKAVIGLAAGADVLVHEVFSRRFWERAGAPGTPELRRHIIESHTDTRDAGRVAREAGVKVLVLSHFVPEPPTGALTDDEWLAEARAEFAGEIILGRDLLVV